AHLQRTVDPASTAGVQRVADELRIAADGSHQSLRRTGAYLRTARRRLYHRLRRRAAGDEHGDDQDTKSETFAGPHGSTSCDATSSASLWPQLMPPLALESTSPWHAAWRGAIKSQCKRGGAPVANRS